MSARIPWIVAMAPVLALGLSDCEEGGCETTRCAVTQQLFPDAPVRGLTTQCQPAAYYTLFIPAWSSWEVTVEPDPNVVVILDETRAVNPIPGAGPRMDGGVDGGVVTDGGATMGAVCPSPPDCNEVASACVENPLPLRLRTLGLATEVVVRVVTPSNLIGYRYGNYTLRVARAATP